MSVCGTACVAHRLAFSAEHVLPQLRKSLPEQADLEAFLFLHANKHLLGPEDGTEDETLEPPGGSSIPFSAGSRG
jgi:hypothetical protein